MAAASPRSRATRATCSSAYAGLMSGSRPEPLAVSASGGHLARGDAVESAATARGAARSASTRSGLSGPRFDADGGQRVVARRRPPTAGSGSTRVGVRRVRRPTVNAWPIRSEPTAWPSRLTSEPSALPRNGDLGDAGHRQRVDEAERRRSARAGCARRRRTGRRRRRRSGRHGVPAVQPIPGIWETSRSMSLMPMNGRDDAAEAVDREVAAQHRGRRGRAVAHAAQRQRDQRDDDQRVEDDRGQDRRLAAWPAA